MVKKLVINIAIVAFVVIILDFAIGSVLRYFYFREISGIHFRTTYALEKADSDIIVFGSSRANHHYVPEIFENALKMSFYNAGRDGAGIFYHTAVLKSILKRNKSKVIILDYAGGFDKRERDYDRLSCLLPYYKYHDEIRRIIELKSSFERIKMVSAIYPFNSEILNIAIGNMKTNKDNYIDAQGYIPLDGELQAEIEFADNAINYEIDNNKVNYFKEFIFIAKKAGAKVIIIYSPIYEKYQKKQEIDICRSICNSMNVPFLDFSKNNLFLQNRQLFRDVEHLNHKGAIVFSNIVVNKIKFVSSAIKRDKASETSKIVGNIPKV
ncbi:MAG: hypothetical protein JXI33_08680 [Candidatus Aminicenantes bacterium]|nr:hypothetical protein [Candidatus Aminicenantes bacterium]